MPPAHVLSALLKRYYLSRWALANDMDVSIQTVHNWCSGRVAVPVHHLGRLAELLRHAGVEDEDISSLLGAELAAHGLDASLVTPSRSPGVKAAGIGMVILVAWDLTTGGLFGHVAQYCRKAIESLGFGCVVVDCGGEHRMKSVCVREAIRQRYDGIVFAGVPGAVPDPEDELLSTVQPAVDAAIPVVMAMPWNGHISLPRGVAAIGWETDASNGIGLDLLIGAGHQAVSVLLSSVGPLMTGRHQGFDRALASRGIPPREELMVWPTNDPDDCIEIRRLLSEATAVFVMPSMLPALANVCYSAGLQWPDDISIVTVGHAQAIPTLGPRPFTCVGVPIGKISRGAAQLLATLTQGDPLSYGQQFVVYGRSSMPVTNAEGGSIGPPRLGKTDLAAIAAS